MDRITVNLAPADLRKEGAAFDLPMALGILSATGVVKPGLIEDAIAIGELSLDGHIRPVRGVLPVALLCRRRGVPRPLVPAGGKRAQEPRGARNRRGNTHTPPHPGHPPAILHARRSLPLVAARGAFPAARRWRIASRRRVC